MQVSTADLRQVINVLLNHLDETDRSRITINKDFYWSITDVLRYDLTQPPKAFSVGQLTDDWRELQRMTDGGSEPIAYGFVWLASILRAIGEESVF